MRVLVTGTAGFIGFHLAKRLLARGDEVIGLDNVNEYYDVRLKHARMAQLVHQRHCVSRVPPRGGHGHRRRGRRSDIRAALLHGAVLGLAPALHAALKAGHAPVPVYIHAPDEEAPWAPGLMSVLGGAATAGWRPGWRPTATVPCG